MFDDAAQVIEKIAPDDKTRNAVLAVQVGLYITEKKCDLAATIASRLVKLEPKDAAWWIVFAYSTRCAQTIEKAEAILLQARELHPKNADISYNLACYASIMGRMEEAKVRLRHAIDLDTDIRRLTLDKEDLRPLWDWIGSSK